MVGELQARIGNGWKAYWKHKYIFWSKMSIRDKTKILENSIPVLTYSAQTWALTKHQMNKLAKTQNSMLRNILGITLKDKIKNKEIYSRTNSAKISYIIKKLKIKYEGHLARNLASTFWIPRDRRRKKGRPTTRWIDELNKEIGPGWNGTAQNRKNWSRVAETYARKWAD